MNTPPPLKTVETLLIVDDLPSNISVLFELLTTTGYKVLVAREGHSAIEKAQYAQPDLILLDIMMPGMNGFEVCQALKSQDETHDIPIIFMTALVDTADKVKGFSLGAADYITKPFQQEEVLARITTHLKLRQTQRVLEQQNKELSAFACMIAHDLKNPLSTVVGFADAIVAQTQEGEILDKSTIEYLYLMRQAGELSLKVVDTLLLLTGVSTQTIIPEPLDMAMILQQVQQRLGKTLIKEHDVEIIIPDSFPLVEGYMPWIEEVWITYLSNAIKYANHPAHIEIGSHYYKQQKMVKFWIKDNGNGLDQESQQKLFTLPTDLYNEPQNERELKLSLSVVDKIIQRLGGSAGVESELGQGSTFYFTLPILRDLH